MSGEMDPKIVELVQKLSEKYEKDGQDLAAYLEGRLYEDYVPYWNYIHLDNLLSLQIPRTRVPDEMIFIMYHQVTELYFKMILHELYQVADEKNMTADFLVGKLHRVNRYFEILTDSFAVMGEGMEPKQFLRFRMSLLPASGFQSAQYRMIEIASTHFINLVNKDQRHLFNEDSSISDMYKYIYWQEGAVIVETGEKTLTLKQFEAKYNSDLLKMARDYKNKNVWTRYKGLPEKEQKNPELMAELKEFDANVNINWPLAHYKTAVTYLHGDPDDIAATGGTNWQKYLPPRFQKRIFYPTLWTATEKKEWGKGWVKRTLGVG
jgi:tryptophan 2,3-dioxygenase